LDGSNEDELARLLRTAIAGDERAYREFLVRAASLVRAWARRKVGGGVDPEDIVQETLLAVHMKRHTWQPDAAVLPWLYAIARYKIVDALRRRGRQPDTGVENIWDVPAEPGLDSVSDWEMRRILDQLSPGQRSVVAAISIDGRSIRETARSFGMTETAVRVALHRGLAAIARRFGRS
jgi:RNA polymerase sigma-70 factor (ECF subfamily)